jgi:hypothetical protein
MAVVQIKPYMRADYMTVQNMQKCEHVFKQYMLTAHGIEVRDDVQVKKTLLRIMTDVVECKSSLGIRTDQLLAMDLTQLNNLTLNIARDVFIESSASEKSGSNSISKSSSKSLSKSGSKSLQQTASFDVVNRDVDVLKSAMKPSLSSRHNNVDLVPRPQISSNLRSEVPLDQNLERLMSERRSETQGQAQKSVPVVAAIKDEPLESNDFASRLQAYEAMRDKEAAELESQKKKVQPQLSAAAATEIPEIPDFAAMAPIMDLGNLESPAAEIIAEVLSETTTACNEDGGQQSSGKTFSMVQADVARTDAQAIYRAGLADVQDFQLLQQRRAATERPMGTAALIEAPFVAKSISMDHFVTLAGFDRDWEVEPERYMHTMGLHAPLRNIMSIATGCVIVPMNALRACTSATVAGSLYHQHAREAIFSYPYLLLNIEDMALCEGTNDAVRRSFTVLRYEKSYHGANGRGYIILVPVQNEKKEFYPAPLSSLRSLRVSLRKPNGVLLSNARDDYRIEKIEYETFNRIYLKIVLDKYFDRNEFYQGDALFFRNSSIVASSAVQVRDSLRTSILDFLNRPEGHDIAELGQPNDSGFYRTFYILAPGTLDQDVGRVEIDQDAIKLIQQLSADFPASAIRGSILNSSLQMVVSLRASLAVSDLTASFAVQNV